MCDGHRNCPLIDYLYDSDADEDADDIADTFYASSDESIGLCSVPAICPLDAFRCTYGGCVPAAVQCDGFADCLDASDESTVLCLAANCAGCREAIRCPAIDVRRLDATCEVRLAQGQGDRSGGHRAENWQRVPCERPVPAGTVATYSCSEFFEPAGRKHQHNDMSRCQRDGTWSRDPLRCRPVCGRRRAADAGAAVPLVVRGQAVAVPFPWHVSIYVRPSAAAAALGTDSLAGYRFWCGATLISESIVITAAHCVWTVRAGDMRLVIGATSSHYFEEEEEVEAADNATAMGDAARTEDLYERTLSVRQIRMHPLYQDRYGNYGSDVALLELTDAVQLGADALPVCIDWQLDDISEHLQHASLGVVMGMGVSEQSAFGERLRWTALPVIDDALCLERQRRDFRKYVTFTTFCAGWANGTGVCNGDSGGGLVFESPGRRWEATDGSDEDYGGSIGGVWFLQGIVSLSPRSQQTMQCDPFAYTIFTKVGMYVQWIGHQMRQMQEEALNGTRDAMSAMANV